MEDSLVEHQRDVPIVAGHLGLLQYFRDAFASDSRNTQRIPIRFAVTATDATRYRCEFATMSASLGDRRRGAFSLFDFRRRQIADSREFNAVLLVPTGIGADLGGHAGDAGPVARLLAEVCDTIVLHPNVVNASDINEMPSNSLYVEGSVVTRLLMGTAGLLPVRSNRVLVIIDAHRDAFFMNAAVNAVNAARATYGLDCVEIVAVDPAVKLFAGYSPSGRAAGRVEGAEQLLRVLDSRLGTFDAVSLSTVVNVPLSFHQDYFDAAGAMVNPWGGVEAMFTHALSSVYDIPTAHAPMFESREIANADPGKVDPRMAAEAVSTTFLQCTLKGLRRSPQIVTEQAAMREPSVLTVQQVSCLVVPEGCLGLPTLAALEQGITVIEVTNRNLMENDLGVLPWRRGQFYRASSYLEAAGLMAALKAGIAPNATRRPLVHTSVQGADVGRRTENQREDVGQTA
ncbi:MAG: DUF3326 domain-containing protein [Gammaproteobacteria bacterium]|nr:DUF3326 domain-containing protein [Gammaproteobacteria bacterium]